MPNGRGPKVSDAVVWKFGSRRVVDVAERSSPRVSADGISRKRGLNEQLVSASGPCGAGFRENPQDPSVFRGGGLIANDSGTDHGTLVPPRLAHPILAQSTVRVSDFIVWPQVRRMIQFPTLSSAFQYYCPATTTHQIRAAELLHGNALRQIARLVHIATARDGDMVG